jgi:hypothetical protein
MWRSGPSSSCSRSGTRHAFAGEDYEAGVFSPEDERYLIERDLRARQYQVVTETKRRPLCSDTP